MGMETSNTLKKIGVASFIMMASVFASRVIGLVRESTIAWMGGAKASVDAYQVAFIIPEILNHIVASGFLSITFIPIFAYYLSNNRDEEGFQVFSIIFNGFGLLLVGFIAITMSDHDGFAITTCFPVHGWMSTFPTSVNNCAICRSFHRCSE